MYGDAVYALAARTVRASCGALEVIGDADGRRCDEAPAAARINNHRMARILSRYFEELRFNLTTYYCNVQL